MKTLIASIFFLMSLSVFCGDDYGPQPDWFVGNKVLKAHGHLIVFAHGTNSKNELDSHANALGKAFQEIMVICRAIPKTREIEKSFSKKEGGIHHSYVRVLLPIDDCKVAAAASSYQRRHISTRADNSVHLGYVLDLARSTIDFSECTERNYYCQIKAAELIQQKRYARALVYAYHSCDKGADLSCGMTKSLYELILSNY
jgi:hypothetical protein